MVALPHISWGLPYTSFRLSKYKYLTFLKHSRINNFFTYQIRTLRIIGTMASLTTLLLILVISFSAITQKHLAKRSADALVRPQVLQINGVLSPYKFPMKKFRLKEKCKVKPLKARSYIKADTIFTGTVVKFYTMPNIWMKQMDTAFLRKGNVKYFKIYWVFILFDYLQIYYIVWSD